MKTIMMSTTMTTVVVTCALLLLLLSSSSSSSNFFAHAWAPMKPLDYPRAFGCTAFWEFYIQLMGGVSHHFEDFAGPGPDSSLYNNIDSLDLTQGYKWVDNIFQKLPLGVAGSTSCANVGGTITLIHLGCQPQLNVNLASNELILVSSQTSTVAFKPTANVLLPRVRGSIFPFNQTFYIVGGMDEVGDYRTAVEMFSKADVLKAFAEYGSGDDSLEQKNLNQKNAAQPITRYINDKEEKLLFPRVKCHLPFPVCDCEVAPLENLVVMVCTDCTKKPPGSTEIPRHGLYNKWFLLNITDCKTSELGAFDKYSAGLTNRTQSEVVSVSVSTIAQYAAMTIYFYDSKVPSVAYWDLYLEQWHFVTNVSAKPRLYGASAAVSNNLIYAGGVEIADIQINTTDKNNTRMTLSNVVTDVEGQPVVKSVSMAVNNATRRFKSDSDQIIAVACTVNYTIRVSTSSRCTGRAQGVPDSVCPDSGVVYLPVPSEAGTYFICASLGSCVGPEHQRIKCPSGNWSDFHTCNVLGGCCYCDISKECFGYRPHYIPNKYENDNSALFFYLNVPEPIYVDAKITPSPAGTAAPESKFTKFLKSGSGITAASLVALVVVVGIVYILGVVWRRASGADDERGLLDDDEEAADQESSQLLQTYKIIKRLGKGGFGYVFLVERKASKQQFALKYIPCPEEKDRSAALREFDAIRAVPQHPSLIKIHDIRMNWAVDPLQETTSADYGTSGDSTSLNNDNNNKQQLARTPVSPREASINENNDSGDNNNNKSSNETSNNNNNSSDNDGASSHSAPSSPTKKKKSTPTTSTKSSKPNSNLQDTLLGISHRHRYVCIVMDFFPEGDLARYIWEVTMVQRQIFPEEWIVGVIGRQLCSVLALMHSQTPPIVHRDLKPENVLLDQVANRAIIVDFGLASKQEHTYMQTRAGSLQYIAPECWKKHYGTSVDNWAVGCILYAAATGRVTAETARVMFNDVNDRHFKREIADELENQCGYSKQFTGLVLSLIEPDPNKRLTAADCLANIDANERWRVNGRIALPRPGSHND